MIGQIKKLLIEEYPQQKLDEIFEYLREKHHGGEDAWGLNLDKSQKSLKLLWPLYKNYFKVRLFGKENVEDQAYTVVSNHTGQIAIDGMLISLAFALEIAPPRILRGMVERFFTTIPFVNTWSAEGGAVLGDRQNFIELLRRGESALVFPEGVRGVSKSRPNYYDLQSFTRGFFRLSLQANTDILPIAVVGAEEMYPFVYQITWLAKKLKLPALPISAFLPLGPLSLLPLPSPIDIHIGKPYKIPSDLSPNASDEEIDFHVQEIEKQIKEMIKYGLKNRREFFFNITNPSVFKDED
jgi:1-acyl-sn-glycerol-3-phosphate acyltransferase